MIGSATEHILGLSPLPDPRAFEGEGADTEAAPGLVVLALTRRNFSAF